MKLPEATDGAILLSPSNLFYFTGYSNADAAIAMTADGNYYITDKRCLEEAESTIKDFEIIDSEGSGYAEKAAAILSEKGCRSVGVEFEEISYKNFICIEKYFKNLLSVSDFVRGLRAVKNHSEIQKIRAAQKLTDRTFERILGIVAPGRFTEASLRSEIDVDFGAKLDGYCSDMTRSFVVGSAPDGYGRVYEAVLSAKNRAEDMISAGKTGKECDAVARNCLEEYGLGKYFTHSLGHSLGIDIHETPVLAPSCDKIIPEGAVTSVEPGVYLPGEFGVRIEDIVLFKKSGVENLTNSPENLIIV